MTWFGWIPVLTDGDVFSLIESEQFRRELDDSRIALNFYQYERRIPGPPDSNLYRISYSFNDGFIEMSMDDNETGIRDYVLVRDLYLRIKSKFHHDYTHSPRKGLLPVFAKNIDVAVRKVADDMIYRCELFMRDIDSISDVSTLKSIYLESRGLIEYGMYFVTRYSRNFGKHYRRYYERFQSISRFLSAFYETKRDTIQDDLAYQNQQLSESMEHLAHNTEFLSITVLGATAFSIIMSVAGFYYDHLGLGTGEYGAVFGIGGLSMLAIVGGYLLIRRCRKDTDE